MLKRTFYQRRLFYKYIFSYLVIFLISISLFGLLNYFKLKSISNQQDAQLHQQNLSVFKYSIENKIADIRGLFSQISNKKWVTNFSVLKISYSNLVSENTFALYEAKKDLRNSSLTVNNVKLIGLFFKNSHLVVDCNNFYDAANYFDLECEIENMGIGKWLSISESHNKFQLLPQMDVKINGKTINAFTFIETIPLNHISTRGVMFSVIEKQGFFEGINLLNIDNNTFGVIIDDKNRIVASTNNFSNDIPLLAYEDCLDENTVDDALEKEYIYYTNKIDSLPWKVVLIVNTGNNTSNLFSSHYLLAVAIIFLFGVLISYYLSLKNYNTLESFLTSLTIINNNCNALSLENCFIAIKNKTKMVKEQELFIDSLKRTYETFLYQPAEIKKDTGSSSKIHDENFSGIFAIGLESQIIKYLTEGDVEAISSMFETLLKEIEKSQLSIYETNLLYYEFVGVVIKFLESTKDNLDASAYSSTYTKLRNTESVKDVVNIIIEICKEIKVEKEETARKNEFKDEELRYKLISFVNENITNNNISLKLVKSEFDLSFSLITKIIKEYSGYGFLEYVNRKRIELAKKLLSDSEYSISVVGELCGYNDDSTFIKTFKRYEGTTPGKYKTENT